jgi:hypothetical protein
MIIITGVSRFLNSSMEIVLKSLITGKIGLKSEINGTVMKVGFVRTNALKFPKKFIKAIQN